MMNSLHWSIFFRTTPHAPDKRGQLDEVEMRAALDELALSWTKKSACAEPVIISVDGKVTEGRAFCASGCAKKKTPMKNGSLIAFASSNMSQT